MCIAHPIVCTAESKKDGLPQNLSPESGIQVQLSGWKVVTTQSVTIKGIVWVVGKANTNGQDDTQAGSCATCNIAVVTRTRSAICTSLLAGE